MPDTFTWVPIYSELATELVHWEHRQSELIALLEDIRSQGYVVTPLKDQDGEGNTFLIEELDPFTFFGTFNRGIRDDQRRGILEALKSHFGLKSKLPSDFSGIPILNNQRSWFITAKYKRKPEDAARLWRVFKLALGKDPLNHPEFQSAFDDAIRVRGTNFNLTMGLFWIRPETFLNLDGLNRSYLNIKMPKGGLSAEFYRETVQSIALQGKSLVELSYEAWLHSQEKDASKSRLQAEEGSYWIVGSNWKSHDPADQTERFKSEGIWENGYKDRYLDIVRSVQVGDRIAIKSTFTRRNDLPFDSHGKTISCMRIKAIGTVVANRNDGRTIEVEWVPNFPEKDWFFTANWRTIQQLDTSREEDQRLIDFAFFGKEQDYAWFARRASAIDSEGQVDTGEQMTSSEPYSAEDIVASGTFLSIEEINQTLERLESKKNLILQGPPGVGKTYLARKLAYALMEEKSDERIEFVQFHQSYSYEDFVRGYRPIEDEGGKFGLQNGVFFEFCERAMDDPDRPYVFIIDEINRGNLSQIFGELLMLIEADKRGVDHAVPLVYRKPNEPRFFVPENVYIIGLMNLADRSLALVDYALRRRFAFLSLRPQFQSEVFNKWLIERNLASDLVDLIANRMGELNRHITEDTLLGENYQVGHSFFCPKGNDFAGLDRTWYVGIVETEIVPLLREYWFDNAKRAEECRERLLAP